MSNEEKLVEIREYVEDMSPIYRAAVLQPPEVEAENRGYDRAMAAAQADLKRILDDEA